MDKDIARKYFRYNPDTGFLYWISGDKAGEVAGTVYKNGYVTIAFGGKVYTGHRLAWVLHYGEWPQVEIDHINHNKSDNRIMNLRAVQIGENQKNMPMSRRNKTGVTGIYLQNAGKPYWRWIASIGINGKNVNLYRGNNLFEACCLRKSAEIEQDFHPNHGKKMKTPLDSGESHGVF